MLSVQFARRLANFGFTMVLIQRKEVDRSHFDTVFYANTLFMGSLPLLLFFTAPFVAQFFENPAVEPILQVLSFDFILRGLFGVPRAILRRKMEFKRL
ncbi:MAG: oligosaccharide flippase family protein, partial [Pseudomonadota bacterium]